MLYTHAGPEIGVASTKAFTSQLIALYLLALFLGQQRGGAQARPSCAPDLADLVRLPGAGRQALALDGAHAPSWRSASTSRATSSTSAAASTTPIALEGALKLKEISYIHAEGYPAGEMKHGPIALIDASCRWSCSRRGDAVFEKMMSNLEEVKARDGIAIVVTDRPARGLRRRRPTTSSACRAPEPS